MTRKAAYVATIGFLFTTITSLLLVWKLYTENKKKDKQLDEYYMEKAIELSFNSKPISTAYCVGCVIVKEGKILSTGYSRELPGNTHAEECALLKLNINETKGADLYTTMEPCSKRLSGALSCVERCISAGIKRIIIGALEPDVFVLCDGVQLLLKANIQVIVLSNMTQRCLDPNSHLLNPSNLQ